MMYLCFESQEPTEAVSVWQRKDKAVRLTNLGHVI